MTSFNEWEDMPDTADADRSVDSGVGAAGGQVVTPDDSPAQMPLGMSPDEMDGDLSMGLDDSSFAAPKNSSTNGLLLLMVVLCVGAGTLWAMRINGGIATGNQAVAEAEQKIDQALRRLKEDAAAKEAAPRSQAAPANLDALFRDTDQIIAMFADDPTQRQVDIDELHKNPFELFIVRDETDSDSGTDATGRARADRLEELQREFDRLTLQSLLSGDTSLAVVSGEVVREGDTVGPFEVASINPYGVRLIAEGETYTLSMEKEK